MLASLLASYRELFILHSCSFQRQAVLGRSSGFCQVDAGQSRGTRRLKAKEWVLSWRFLYHPGLLGVLFQSAPVICSLDYCGFSFNKERKEERAPCIVLEHKLSKIHLRPRLSTVALALCALCFLSLLCETHPMGKVGDGCLRPWQLPNL